MSRLERARVTVIAGAHFKGNVERHGHTHTHTYTQMHTLEIRHFDSYKMYEKKIPAGEYKIVCSVSFRISTSCPEQSRLSQLQFATYRAMDCKHTHTYTHTHIDLLSLSH